MNEKLVTEVHKILDPFNGLSIERRLNILNRTLKELNILAKAVYDKKETNPGALPLWWWEAETQESIDVAKDFYRNLQAEFGSGDEGKDLTHIEHVLELFQR